MDWLTALGAGLQVALRVMDLLIKTPEEKVQDVLRAIMSVLQDVKDGVEHAEETNGDTSKLEDAINRARRR